MNRAMLGRMVMRAAAGQLPPGTALIAVARHLTEASVAVAAGADVVDLGAAPAEIIAAFRALHPGILVCATAAPADVVREPASATASGALLVCADADAAAGSGIPADRVLVDVPPAMVPAVSQTGLAALVDVDRAARLAAGGGLASIDVANLGLTARRGAAGRDPTARHDLAAPDLADRDLADRDLADRDPADDDLTAVAGIVAIAAVSSWLGARAVRTRYPSQVRRALDMTASVRGNRPPARTIRGLA
jgi:dihydropteroate synthase